MDSNQTDDEEHLFSDLTYFLSGPVIIIVAIFGTIFNLYTIFILTMQMMRRKTISHELIVRFDSNSNNITEGSMRNNVPLTKTYGYRTIKKTRPRIYIYFLWLTCCDTALLISSVFMYSVPIVFDCYNGPYAKFIPFWYMMCNFTFSASVLLMLALMFERYRTLCSPFTSAVIALSTSSIRIHTTLAIVTIFALFFSFPRMYEFFVVYNESEQMYLIYRTDLVYSPAYVIGYRIFGSLLFYSACPYILIFVMSFKIWSKMSAASHARAQMNVLSSLQAEKVTSEKIFIAITIKFLISRFASTSFDVVEHSVGAEAFIGSSLAMFCVHINNLIVVISSALNFLIFYSFSRSFRKAVSNLCLIMSFYKNIDY